MKFVRAAIVLAAGSLLVACSGHSTKPVHRDSHARARASGATTTSSRDRFNDDLSKPQGRRYRDGKDSVPPPLDVRKLVEPVPKVEPRSLYGNKSPYTVLGRSYRVLPNARGYKQRGIASFYGNKFHGYKTSSLETYDMYAFSAASTTLPLPSYARVTNLESGKSVIVRVNDRGPFHANRLIDLSYAAAVKIGIWPKGTGLVEVQGIDPSRPGKELPPAPAVTGSPTGIYLQVGAFADTDNANRLAQRLRQSNLGAVQISDAVINGRRVHRVRIGPLDTVERADQVSSRIEDIGLPRPQVALD